MRAMKPITALIISLLLVSPPIAAASTLDDYQSTLQYALSAVTALTADQPVSCTILTSKSIVKVNETFTFAWYSTGRNVQVSSPEGLAWAPFSIVSMKISTPGKRTYTLKFYGPGTVIPCSRTITVVP